MASLLQHSLKLLQILQDDLFPLASPTVIDFFERYPRILPTSIPEYPIPQDPTPVVPVCILPRPPPTWRCRYTSCSHLLHLGGAGMHLAPTHPSGAGIFFLSTTTFCHCRGNAIPMPWLCHGSAVAVSWQSYGAAMAMPCQSLGHSMALPWY